MRIVTSQEYNILFCYRFRIFFIYMPVHKSSSHKKYIMRKKLCIQKSLLKISLYYVGTKKPHLTHIPTEKKPIHTLFNFTIMHYKLYKVGDTHNAPHRVRVSLFPVYAATNIFTSKLKNINHKACVRGATRLGAKEYILQGAAAAAHDIHT